MVTTILDAISIGTDFVRDETVIFVVGTFYFGFGCDP